MYQYEREGVGTSLHHGSKDLNYQYSFVDKPSEGTATYSVSHTGAFWFCVVGDGQAGSLGLDCEILRDVPYEKLARRFFHADEATFVADQGREAFFQLWTMKEAWFKYAQEPFFGVLKHLCLVDDQGAVREAKGAKIRPLDLSCWHPDLVGTLVFRQGDEKGEDLPLTMVRLDKDLVPHRLSE